MNMEYGIAFALALISTLVLGKIGIPLLQRLKAHWVMACWVLVTISLKL